MNEDIKFRPLHDRVLVERIKADDKSPGGIIIPENAKEKPQEGIVRAVGKGRVLDGGQLVEVLVKPGDKVIFGKYAGTEISGVVRGHSSVGDDYLVISQNDILGVILE